MCTTVDQHKNSIVSTSRACGWLDMLTNLRNSNPPYKNETQGRFIVGPESPTFQIFLLTNQSTVIGFGLVSNYTNVGSVHSLEAVGRGGETQYQVVKN